MISLLLALLLLATPAVADHLGSAGGAGGGGGGGGSKAPSVAMMHCIGDGTTREGRSCNSGSTTDCDGTCANGWCGALGDSLPCTANTDCDGTCDSVSWGRYFDHTGDCSCTTSSCGGTCGGGTDNTKSWASAPPDGGYLTCDEDSDCHDGLNYTNDSSSGDPFFIHTSTDPDAALHCYSDTQGRMAITDDRLEYCDADGVKRTVLHGYATGAFKNTVFLRGDNKDAINHNGVAFGGPSGSGTYSLNVRAVAGDDLICTDLSAAVSAAGTPNTTEDLVVVLRKNGVDTDLTCTIDTSAGLNCTDTGLATFTPTDMWAIKYTCTGTDCPVSTVYGHNKSAVIKCQIRDGD